MDHRLFIGLRPPPALRAALLAEMHGVDRARWQDDGQLHLTLRFVGEVSTHTANDLVERLAQIHAAPFALEVMGTGAFERRGMARTLWAGIAAGPALAHLQQKVERACQSAGVEAEARRFTPHITLARLNAGSGSPIPFLARTGTLHLGGWTVDEFVLYESHLRSEGSLYERIASFPLDATRYG
jgi:2'-5' RNA ligase